MAKFKYDKDLYHPEAVGPGLPLSYDEARAEYNRLRKTALSRIAALEKAGKTDYKVYKYNKEKFIPSGGEISNRKIGRALSDVARFVSAKSTTVQGIKQIERKSVSTLISHGFTEIDMENVEDFGKFMRYARAKYAGRTFDSVRVANLWNAAVEKGVSPVTLKRNFQQWLDNTEKLQESAAPTIQQMRATGASSSGSYFKRVFGIE